MKYYGEQKASNVYSRFRKACRKYTCSLVMVFYRWTPEQRQQNNRFTTDTLHYLGNFINYDTMQL